MGKQKSPEHKAKIAAALKGRKCSEDHIAAMRKSWETRTPSPQFLAAGRVAWLGRQKSLESKIKFSKTRTKPAEERFWSRVDRSGDCWLWTGARQKFGYGTFSIGSKLDGTHKVVLAHRFSYELTNGTLLDGLNVLHRCDNPSCVRPDHLFVGTQAGNVSDMMSKGRTKTRISDLDVSLIRNFREQGLTITDLASAFGASIAQVSRITRGLARTRC